MTYSIAAKCPRTGMFGAAVTTSSIGVGARCAYARAGVGAVLTQHRTDPRLGPKGLELLAQGPAGEGRDRAPDAGRPGIGWRQLAVIDNEGTHRRVPRRQDHLGALGRRRSRLHRDRQHHPHHAVTRAMVDAFGADPQLHLAERLVRAMEAGYAAGGNRSR
jgi:uncharacterized Ntn-hydrolase superfamily protein